MAAPTTAPAAQVRAAVRLLTATASVLPIGQGRAAIRQGGTILGTDLADLGPLGTGQDEPVLAPAGARDLGAAVLRARVDQNAAIVAITPHLTAWGLARRALPVRYSPLIRFTADAQVPVAAGSDLDAVVAAFIATPGLRALLVPGHGVVVLGADLAAAARALIGLEEAARLTWQAEAIGGAQPFPDDASDRTARGIAGSFATAAA